ncbi:MAG: hypothetical protein ACTIDN_00870 [Acetobacter sp.]|uniref:hypothetical protein n=1 Tax=Acetobacter sp. TaxID=440 RepID=UPI003F9059F5
MAVFEEYLDECRNVVSRHRLPRLSREQAAGLFCRIMEAVPVRGVVDRMRELFLRRYPAWVANVQRGITESKAAKRQALA